MQNPAAQAIEPLEKSFHVLFHLVDEFAGDGAGEEVGKGPHILGDGHLVIVQYHHQVLVQVPGVVEPLIGDAAGHGPVTDHRDDLVVVLAQITGHGKTKGGGDGGGGVPHIEGIVHRLCTLGETADPTQGAQGAKRSRRPVRSLWA